MYVNWRIISVLMKKSKYVLLLYGVKDDNGVPLLYRGI